MRSGGASYRQGRAYSPTIFVRALPRALPLGQEAKKLKSPWSIVLLSWKFILSVYNAGKPFGGRGSARTRWGAYSAPQAP